MKNKNLAIFTVLPVLAGILIGFLRYQIFSNFYDAEFDILNVASRSWENGLLLLCVVFFVLLWFLSRAQPRDNLPEISPWNAQSKTLLLVSAIMFAGSGVYTYFTTQGILAVVSALFLIFCAVCIFYLPYAKGATAQFVVVVPIFMYVYELFAFFKSVGKNPHVFRYSFEIVAAVSVLFLAYAVGAFLFERGTSGKLLTIYSATILLFCAIGFGNMLIYQKLGLVQLMSTHYMLSACSLAVYATAWIKALKKPELLLTQISEQEQDEA